PRARARRARAGARTRRRVARALRRRQVRRRAHDERRRGQRARRGAGARRRDGATGEGDRGVSARDPKQVAARAVWPWLLVVVLGGALALVMRKIFDDVRGAEK